jgi:hypothetical protein
VGGKPQYQKTERKGDAWKPDVFHVAVMAQAQPSAGAKAQGQECPGEVGAVHFGWSLEYIHIKLWAVSLEK